ncbi:2-keto-4-pentenoate hydratase/2-oxohepta-3-ene-1,7-dioic acid hydratase in catechol pathway [Streptomyces aurantiacus]|uniref:fumarylacetoacetate hydrolase family protein n=1 Tax=Streptomyces aurantiacus TaxID=47760 RepID=UPI00278E4E54|nr:fumarylacetoacetate hydrolase family protein [Streptomyces aurantiacus]MDQ0775803.1 2-keto-4-pentenoate hydratase/2-oxohepta-3-ene-1,7-dioic acid hydratase in catechol pathway [Streptomyces aurantiacus]
MRIANVDSRLTLLVADGPIDVALASKGRFGPDPQAAYESFDDLRRWAEGQGEPAPAGSEAGMYDPRVLGPVAPAPRQVFAIGLNYREHAAEGGITTLPDEPTVFAKYPSSFSGPVTEVPLPAGSVDWEVELVAVISRTARDVDPARAWDHVAGLTVGQDLSERQLQLRGPVPQFSLSKSHPGFSPTGPVLVTPDELPDADDLEIGCAVNDEQMQKARTAGLIFSVPQLVAYLSTIVTLYPGDVIFTGTPAGVGAGRTPQRYLRPGDELLSWVEGIGELRQRFVPGRTGA